MSEEPFTKVVHRIEVPVDDIPHGFVIGPVLHVDCRELASVDVWFERVHPRLLTEVTYQVFGTGQPIPPGAKHVGTALTPGSSLTRRGTLVWHLYELVP